MKTLKLIKRQPSRELYDKMSVGVPADKLTPFEESSVTLATNLQEAMMLQHINGGDAYLAEGKSSDRLNAMASLHDVEIVIEDGPEFTVEENSKMMQLCVDGTPPYFEQ